MAFLIAMTLLVGSVVRAPAPALSASQLGLDTKPTLAPVTIEQPDAPVRPNLGEQSGSGLLSVVAIGDSVMVDTQNALRAQIHGIYVDAKVGRHTSGGVAVLRALRDAHRLGDVVVIHLGTNGRLNSSDFDELMSVLTDVPRVVFVNLKVPRSWETPDNRAIAAGVKRYPNTVLVDWHNRWHECGAHVFWNDGVHPTPSGAACYARMVAAAI
jgi:lysophospholipase L1-like esterase